jgi:predicted  nucleic acid-binding Zn-ribbon protein
MDTETRQQLRLIHDTREEYASLNDLLAKKKVLEDQLADLLQQAAGLKRRITAIDQEFSKQIITVRPSVVESKAPHNKRPSDLSQRIAQALKANPSLATKLADLDLDI